MKRINILLLAMMFTVLFTSCKKFLDKKPDVKLATPDNLQSLQKILDNNGIMNVGFNASNASTDEYFLKYDDWNSLDNASFQKNGYIWADNAQDFEDWSTQYKTIFFANTVLDNLNKIEVDDQQSLFNDIKGQALFFRAHSYFELAQIYMKPYKSSNAVTELGIPLRLDADFTKPSTRSTMEQTYSQILQDLNKAIGLLPDKAKYQNRGSKCAVYALLSRIYMVMGDYSKAKDNATACLQLYSDLLDYSSTEVSPTNLTRPFKAFNREIIFYNSTKSPVNVFSSARIDSILYSSYVGNDWRKTAFFRSNGDGTFRFKGSYNGNLSDLFNGIATDEIYLTRAECFARLGDKDAALQDLNTLLQKRWKAGTFTAFTASDANAALALILAERKKELVYRGIRWLDIRRLNVEGANILLKRILNTQTYSLPPNDNRYALLIPQNVIDLSGIAQNPR